MKRKERAKALIDYFQHAMPTPETELAYTNPFELLCAVILSAQCTDKRVNMVTPFLFEAYPSASELSQATPEEVFTIIKSISFPNNKSKHLVGMAKMLIEQHNGKVPSTLNELTALPGVGRKTANVILSVIFDQPALAVDTHVFRVSKRIGLANQNCKTPLEVEKQLVRHIPKGLLPKAHHWIILHGRYVCMARKPLCDQCAISSLCRYYEKKQTKLTHNNLEEIT